MMSSQFLAAVQPDGPWLITAIVCRTLTSTLAKTAGEVDALVAIFDGSADLYWTPALPRQAPASGKPKKSDIAGSRWQWCDLDPPKGADLATWRADALRRLRAAGPTIIVDSGRGYWGLWLRPTFSTDHAEIEGINRALGGPLGADACWNIDRLARLPGTINLKTGNRAAVLEWNPGPAALPAPAAITTVAPTDANWTDRGADPAQDDELIERALVETVPPFGNRVTFAQLWNAEADALASRWPPRNDMDLWDRSEADMGLASRLMRMTGGDCARTERIMRRSGLARDKWNKQARYLRLTILKTADPAKRRAEQLAENARIGAEQIEPALPAVLTLGEMEDRLVYIGSNGAVVDSATHRVRKKDAAAGEYAASVHSYKDPKTGKAKKTAALGAWIGSRDRKTVDVLAWVPGAPQICTPPEIIDGGTRAFNMWRGIAVNEPPDDWRERAAPFVEHLIYLVPIEAERRRFIQWIAHMIRHPETLPHTAYLFVTDQTGIGRNALASVLVRVLCGYVAAGVDIAAILDGKFNGRLSQKLLAIVDEVREGLGERRYQRGERLKSLITEEHRQIDVKYGLQSVEKNCCRWLMFSNHIDALPFENTDRRVIVIANPTERRSPDYYTRFYGLIDDPAFIASVRAYLDAVDLSDFKPGEHAPMNAAKSKALAELMSDTDRAVIDFRDSFTNNLTTRQSIKAYVQMQHRLTPNENHLTKAIARAGMVNTGRRVTIGNTKQSVVIVRNGMWTPEMVNDASGEALVSVITGTPGTPGTPVHNHVAN
jgi:hypothetical protein